MSSICTPSPGNFLISLTIKSIILVILFSLINLELISKSVFINS